MKKLSENIYDIYIHEKDEDIRNKSLYVLGCALLVQSLVGNEKTLKPSIVVYIVSGLIAVLSEAHHKLTKEDYLDSMERLRNVSEELTLLGYDLDINAMLDCTLYQDGLIAYQDKYENTYYLYECIKDDEVRYYSLITDDIDECLSNKGMSEDVTKIIKRGLNKQKSKK